nr:60S ribosomal protein L36-like [Desmodus rotundus]
MALHYPVAVNLNKGHKVTKDESKPRHSCPRGHLTECTKVMQDVNREVCVALPPKSRPTTRALQFIRKRVGTHIPAKKKREELSNVLAAMRKATAEKD